MNQPTPIAPPPLSGKHHLGRKPKVDTRMPWANGVIGSQRPRGLRERVLRVAYLKSAELAKMTDLPRDPQLATLIDWRRKSPQQFAELCKLLDVPQCAG